MFSISILGELSIIAILAGAATYLALRNRTLRQHVKDWRDAHAELSNRHGKLASAYIAVRRDLEDLERHHQGFVDAVSKTASTAAQDAPVPTLADALSAGQQTPGEAPPTAQAVADATQADAYTLEPTTDKPVSDGNGPISST